jgi:hypothetical protein
MAIVKKPELKSTVVAPGTGSWLLEYYAIFVDVAFLQNVK